MEFRLLDPWLLSGRVEKPFHKRWPMVCDVLAGMSLRKLRMKLLLDVDYNRTPLIWDERLMLDPLRQIRGIKDFEVQVNWKPCEPPRGSSGWLGLITAVRLLTRIGKYDDLYKNRS